MIVIAFVLVALVVALIRGGDLRALAEVKLRWWGLAPVAVAMQLAAFSSLWARAGPAELRPIVYVMSLGLLVIVSVRNWRLPGVALLAAGLLANALAIALNGGHMPVDPRWVRAALEAGTAPGIGVIGSPAGSVLIGPETILPFLCDVFVTPRWFPIHNAFSPGDVLIAAGAAWFFLGAVKRGPAEGQ